MSENYIPLYRKYRPQTLETLVGQEHVKKALTSAIELGKISHAYLFTGPRGTGKTSTARILAKSLNCINGPTVKPCGECASCKDITNSVPIDVIEMDAASNRSVEDAQNILEKVQYAPINGKYKIYIIDEVHMLTKHAFNALLKTLEEPPENVVFILATTEVHKVLDTIKSRCQRYDFRRITTNDIAKHLKSIAEKEKIKITDDALFLIAKNAAGGMRDSLSLLDQLSILGISKEITVEDVNAILGRVSFDVLLTLSNKIIASSISEAIEVINGIYSSGNEPLQILINMFEYFKNLLIVKTCSKDLLLELTGLNEPQIEELIIQKDKLETHQIVFLIERISYYIKEIKFNTNQHLWLEVAIIDLANMSENSKLLELQNRIMALESGNACVATQLMPAITKPSTIVSQKIEQAEAVITQQSKPVNGGVSKSKVSDDSFTPPPISKKTQGNDINSLWQLLLSNIKSPSTGALLKLATPLQIAPEGVLVTFKNEKLVSQINDSNKKQLIIDAANTMFNQSSTNVTIRIAQAGDVQVQPVNTTQVVVQQKEEVLTNKEKAVEKKEQLISSITDESSSESISNEKNIRLESDQEKMVLDLFDGKYVE